MHASAATSTTCARSGRVDPVRLLGAILAGGQSRRCGSDKAAALVDGTRLIDRVAASLAEQCETVVVCGRNEPAWKCLVDRPASGLGPLVGLNAALAHGAGQGFDAVLASGCDIPDLPPDLLLRLGGEGAAIVESQPVVGLWPVALAPVLDRFLADGGPSLYRFADHARARRVAFDPPLGNVNTPEDLRRWYAA